MKKLKASKSSKQQSDRKRPAEQLVVRLVLPIMVEAFLLFNSPFVQQEPPAPRPPSKVEQNLETCVSTVACMDTGLKNAKIQGAADSQRQEEIQHEQIPDIYQVQDFDNFMTYFEYESGNSNINVKNRLKESLPFWKSINTCDFILDVIEFGYKIPFVNEPESVFLKNNKSALDH